MKRISITILAFFAFLTAFGQGENCATATSVTPDGTCYLTNTVGASDDITGEVGCATTGGANGHRDQWFSFVATDNEFSVSTSNVSVPSGNIEILLISGSCASPTLEFSTCGAMPLTDQFVGLIIGNTYWVVVSTAQGNTDDGSFNVCIDNNPVAPAPPNDDCTGATLITPDGSCNSGYNTNGNDSWTGEIGCATAGGAAAHLDVWYSFVATGGVFDIVATDLTVGGDLEIVLVSPGATPCVSSFTELATFCGPSPVVGNYAGLIPGNTYYYTVSSPANQVGTFETCVTTSNIPNDECIGAIPLPVGTNGICTEYSATNAGATASAGVPAPTCGNYAGGDVWFSIVVPPSGSVTFGVDFAAFNSLSDVDMEIYSGTCGSLTSIDCDDNSGTGALPDIQATGLTPGSTVYIRVWDNGNTLSGNFDLCISEPPVILSNQDCNTALNICSDANFGGASNGSGSVTDLTIANEDCLSGENQSSWLYMEISSPGVFMFTISPDNGTDDYDFALWHYPGGAGQSCPPADGDVDRCSYGAGAGFGGSYDTGLDDGTFVSPAPVDLSESASGDNWVSELNVATGDAIMLLIDNFSSSTSPYTLDFTGNAGLNCTILPTELMTFYVKAEGADNVLIWKTNSEINNAYFTIQHSVDGEVWETIGTKQGVGNSMEKQTYSFVDLNVRKTVNYYRLFQTDFDGTEGSFKVISIDNSLANKVPVLTTNLIGQKVDENYKGIVIDVFEDGTSLKRLQNQ